MKSFLNHIDENTLFTTQAEKDALVNDDKAIINAFVFSFIGMVALLDSAKDNTRIKMHFKSDQKLRVDDISDNNNDTSLIIKIMSDKKFFKNPITVTQITKFLVKVKQGTIDEVDANIIRGWLDDIKPEKLMLLPAGVKVRIKAFRDGQSLGAFAKDLSMFALYRNSGKLKDTEYYNMAKITKLNPAKVKAAPTPVAAPATAVSDQPTTAKDVPVAKTAKAPAAVKAAPAKIVAVQYDHNNMVVDFLLGKTADEVDAKYKTNLANRKDLLLNLANDYSNNVFDGHQAAFDNALQFIKKYSIDQRVLQQAILGVSGSTLSWQRSKQAPKRVVKLSRSGLFSLFDKETSSRDIEMVFKESIRSIIGDYLGSPLTTLQSGRDELAAFFNTPMIKRIATRSISYSLEDILVLAVLTNKTAKEALSAIAGFTTRDGDTAYHSFEDISTTAKEILVHYGVKKQNPVLKLIAMIDNSNKFPWRDLEASMNGEDTKRLSEYLYNLKDRDPNRFNGLAKKAIRNASNIPQSLKFIAIDFIARMDVVNIFKEMAGMWAYSSTLESVLSMPSDLRSMLLDNMYDTFKNTKFADLDNSLLGSKAVVVLQDLAKQNNQVDRFRPIVSREFVASAIHNASDGNSYISGYGWSEPMNDNNPFYGVLSKDQQNEIDNYTLSIASISPNKMVYGAMAMYGQQTPQNQKRFLSLVIKENMFIKLALYIDQQLFDDIPVDDFIAGVSDGSPIDSLTNLSGINKSIDVAPYFDKVISHPAGKQNLEAKLLATQGGGIERKFVELVGILAESKAVTEVDFSKYVDTLLTNLPQSRKKEGFIVIKASAIAAKKENLSKKDWIMVEKANLHVDTNIPKTNSAYKEFMTSAQQNMVSYVKADRNAAEKLYQSMSLSMQRRMAGAYLSEQEFAVDAKTAITNSSNPIKPFEALTDKRVKEILKYNNVTSEETKLPAKHIKSFDAMDSYIKVSGVVKPVVDLQVETIDYSAKEMAQLTANLHRSKRSNKHGSNGLVFKKAFKVAIPMQVKAHEEWIGKDPSQEIINPMYHGTGSVAASMILRYGFRVIKSGDSSVVGRMLGDGVYGAINIDKSQQYVGDAGFGRNIGTKGYIFEMDAALGKKDVDYKAMGLSSSDGIRSPEWCVFTPNSQFLILKAYEVEIVAKSTIDTILANNSTQVAVRENNRPIKFKSFLKEYTMEVQEADNYTTYTFVNGLVPTGNGDKYVDFEDFKSSNNNITLEPSAYGPSIVVKGTAESNDYLFTSPTDLMVNHPDLWEKYLEHFEK